MPHTPQSALARRIQKEEDKISKALKLPRVKIVERGGKTLMDMLARPNPWASQPCGREGCWVCKTEEGQKSSGKCNKEGIVYRIQCMTCKELGVTADYIGESSRSAYQQGKEHARDIREGVLDILWSSTSGRSIRGRSRRLY